MIVHSLDSLVHSQSYFNLPNSVKEELTHYLGHRLSSIWIDLYRMSRRGEVHINKAYSLFAKIWGCCRRTAMRAISRLERAGFIKKSHNEIEGCSIANTYIVKLPDSLLDKIKSCPKRKQPMPQIDYSIDQDLSTNGGGDKSVTDLLIVNKDINNITQLSGNSGQPLIRKSRITEPKTAIVVYDEEKKSQNPVNCLSQTPKSLSQAVINRVKKIVNGIPCISNPSGLVEEAIYFIANRKEGYDEWRAVGAFKKLLGNDGHGSWSTPWAIRNKK